MRYQNGLNRVLLLRANDLGFHATTTSAVSRRSARAQLTDDYSERRGTSGSPRTNGHDHVSPKGDIDPHWAYQA
jgi:hypothetical protein